MNNDIPMPKGFVPLQELQALAKKKFGSQLEESLTPRGPTPCPPKPDNYKNSSFYGDREDSQIPTKNNKGIQNLPSNVKQPQQIQTTKMPQSHIFSKYQIRQDTCFYIRFGVTWIDDRIVVVKQDKLNPDIESHWMKFRMWSYEQCNKIKNNCCQLDQYKNYVYNKTKLFKQSVKYLLLDWSFGINNPNMRLMHVNKILSDESISLFMNMHPNILFYIQNKLKGILQGNK